MVPIMKRLLVFVICCTGAFGAAFNATTIWRTSIALPGVDTNGGAFDPSVASAGTNESQTAGVAITVTLTGSGTTGTGSPAFTSTTHGPGDFIHIASGTGCTVGWYEILSQSSGTATFNVSMGSSTDNCVGTIGGPLLTIAKAAALVVAGNNVCVKADGTYSISANIAMSTAGAYGAPIIYQGYTTTCGVSGSNSDQGKATVQASEALTGMFTISGDGIEILNFILDNGSHTGTASGINLTGSALIDNVQVKNFATDGIIAAGYLVLSNSRITGGLSGCTTGIASTSANGFVAFMVVVDTNACVGIRNQENAFTCAFCIIANNTGSDGIVSNYNYGVESITNSLFYGNGGAGFHELATNTSGRILLRNNVFWNNTGGSILVDTLQPGNVWADWNAYAAASLSGATAGANDVILTADPTVAGASLNFAPNATEGGGAALKVKGFPGVLGTGGTGYLSIGPLQPNPAGSAAPQTSWGTAQ